MAIPANSVSAAPSRAPRPRQAPSAPSRTSRHRHLRQQARRARVMVALAVCILVSAVFFVGFGQNLLGTQQMRLDGLQAQLTTAKQVNEELSLERAQLAAPARVLQLAQHRLGMVTPHSVIYLTPIAPGKTVAQHAAEVAHGKG